MIKRDLQSAVKKGVFLRFFVIQFVIFSAIYLWQILFVAASARDAIIMSLVFFISFLLLVVGGFWSVYRYLRGVLVQPVLAIHQADQQSHVERIHFKRVKMDSFALDEFQHIADFRNALVSQLEERERRVHLKAPLEEIHSEIHKLTDGIIAALTKANEYNDDDTGAHMKRLGLYSRLLGEKKKLPEPFIAEIERYAPLHDVGKIGMPDSILKKPGRLSKEEWAVMKTHSKIGYDILKSVGLSPIAQNIALFHHERWSGMGYPEGLKGEEIPIEARIVAIADVFDALVNARVYKPSFPRDKVESILFSEIGRHFDPELGKIVCESLDEFYKIWENNRDE